MFNRKPALILPKKKVAPVAPTAPAAVTSETAPKRGPGRPPMTSSQGYRETQAFIEAMGPDDEFCIRDITGVLSTPVTDAAVHGWLRKMIDAGDVVKINSGNPGGKGRVTYYKRNFPTAAAPISTAPINVSKTTPKTNSNTSTAPKKFKFFKKA